MKGTKPKLVQDKKAIAAVPRAPSWMSKDARTEWRRIMPLLVERKILTEGDMASVENYCLAVATAREASRELQADGHTYKDERGLIKRHPASLVMRDAIQSSRQLAAELGLTPVSRSRPSIRDDADSDDDLLE